jgi:hypothetical protein
MGTDEIVTVPGQKDLASVLRNVPQAKDLKLRVAT